MIGNYCKILQQTETAAEIIRRGIQPVEVEIFAAVTQREVKDDKTADGLPEKTTEREDINLNSLKNNICYVLSTVAFNERNIRAYTIEELAELLDSDNDSINKALKELLFENRIVKIDENFYKSYDLSDETLDQCIGHNIAINQWINDEIECQHSYHNPGTPSKPVSCTLPCAVLHDPFHRSGRAAGHNNGNAMTDGKEQDEKDPCCDLLLDGYDGQDGCDKAKGTGAGKNSIGQSKTGWIVTSVVDIVHHIGTASGIRDSE